ncbi:response regulator [Dechloromonas agitata]|uniref:response regulator transcription factor n=1 Tax=Dechloromonas agitata TaxID=73030 RepID=UPI00237DAD74|nr:response regulator [Dechloromonas agitata]MDE1545521.1 response regulator [Dechloromonas agitata]
MMGLTAGTYLIYLVDGDADNRDFLVAQFEANGFTVFEFESAEAFLENRDRIQAGCLVLELNLPGMNGLELQSHLNQLQIPLPLIFVASSADVASAVRAIQNGAVDFLRKGSDSAQLIAIANRLVTANRTGKPAPWRHHPYAPFADSWRNI